MANGIDPTLDAADEFQSLSPLAAAALVLGLISPLALAAPLLMVVPVAAILAGLLALAKIRTSAGALTGERLARWGIGLAVACLAAALVRGPIRDALLRRQTAAVGQQWIELAAAGRVEEAITWITPTALQSLGPRELAESTTPNPADFRTVILEAFRTQPLLLQLARMKPPLAIAPSAAARPSFDGPRTYHGQIFEVTAADGAHCHVVLNLLRTDEFESDGRPWRINSWELGEAD
jgi:hypothetical protein